jgi:hypothetical protein
VNTYLRWLTDRQFNAIFHLISPLMGGQSVVPAISGHAEMPLVKVIVEAFMAAYTRPHPASQACSAWTAMPDRLLDDLKEIRSMIPLLQFHSMR